MFDTAFTQQRLDSLDNRRRTYRELIRRQQESLDALRENPQLYIDAEIRRMEAKLAGYQTELDNI